MSKANGAIRGSMEISSISQIVSSLERSQPAANNCTQFSSEPTAMAGKDKRELDSLLRTNSVSSVDSRKQTAGSSTDSSPGEDGGHHSLTTNCQTMMHLLKGNIGTGVLAMPSALKNAGLLVGSIGVVLIGIICIHCMHMLLKCNRILSARKGVRTLDFAGVTSEAVKSGPYALRPYSKAAGKIINGFLILTQIGFCCVYFVFVAASLQKVLEGFFPQNQNPSVKIYLLALLPLMICYNFIRSLKTLAFASMFANMLQIGGMVLIFYKIFQDGAPDINSVPWATGVKHLPLYFGTAIYAFEGIGIVLPLENEMRHPEDFTGVFGVMNTGMSLVVILYTAVGFFGYAKYGDAVKGSITLSFTSDWLSETVRGIFTVSIFLSYGLQLYVPIQIFWPWLKERYELSSKHSERSLVFMEWGVRALFVCFTFVLASVIPQLELFISLVGALASSSLALIIPPIIELLTHYDEEMTKKRWYAMLSKDLLIMLFGITGFVSGTAINLGKVVQCISSECPKD